MHVTRTKNLAATGMAREAGVVMVSLPRHTRLTDSSLWMGPFSDRLGKYYDDALRMWMREHVGRPVTTYGRSPKFLMKSPKFLKRRPSRMLLAATERRICGH